MSAFFADIYLNKNDVKAMVVASGICPNFKGLVVSKLLLSHTGFCLQS